MESLPAEIVSDIFSRLSVVDWGHCARVNLKWRFMTSITVANQRKVVSITNKTYEQYLQFIPYFSYLPSVLVNLNDRGRLLKTMDVLTQCGVTSLTIVSMLCIAQTTVTQAVQGLRNLRFLTIDAPLNNYACLTHILDACPELASLSITVPRYVKLGSILSCRKAHEYMNLVSFYLKAPGKHLSLMPLLSRCPNLRKLELHVQAASYLDKDTLLSTCENLEYLRVSNYFIDPLLPDLHIQWTDRTDGNAESALDLATNQMANLTLCR